MIPRKIHYCWFGPKPLPPLVKKCIKSWQEHLPEYEICLWNESNSPMQIPFVHQAYSCKKYAFVSDYIRFWALYKYGGIYMDTDMFVLKSLDDLLDNQVFIGWETIEKKTLSCGIIGTVPGDQFINGIVDHYDRLNFTIEAIPSLVVPGIVSQCYRGFNEKDKITIYPFDYFYPFPYEEKENVSKFMKYSTENSYAIHLWNISWGTWHAKSKDRLFYYLRAFRKQLKSSS